MLYGLMIRLRRLRLLRVICIDKRVSMRFLMICFFLFFFSSRRRHTRLQGDWSSDVCSSDLADGGASLRSFGADAFLRVAAVGLDLVLCGHWGPDDGFWILDVGPFPASI